LGDFETYYMTEEKKDDRGFDSFLDPNLGWKR
jgi:hypothetical protein